MLLWLERRASRRFSNAFYKYGNLVMSPQYDKWCWFLHCKHVDVAVPHWRRPDCPEPSDYVDNFSGNRT